MEKKWTWLALLLVALVAFAGCSDDDDDPITPVVEDTAFEVLAAAGAAYINDNTDCPGVASPTALGMIGNEDEFTIIDIRAESAYLAGHIPGAYHSSLGTLVDDLLTFPTDKPYLLVCYSGQSAGHAKIAMELLGYEDVKSIGFGMCGWSTETNGSWESNYGDNLVGDIETTNNNGDLTTQTWPVLEDLGYAAGTVVVERVRDTLAEGFKSIKYLNSTTPSAQLAGHEDEYFIINYFGEADYLGTGTSGVPGHIPGAYQFTPYASLGIDQMLENVPTDMPVVVYCWTGQHSSQITFYLNMLGYDAYSLSFGSNGLFHSDLSAHKWAPGGPTPSQGVVEGPVALPAYAALYDELDDYFMDNSTWYYSASALETLVDDSAVTVLDIRSAEAWGAGHIEGAINVASADIPAEIAAGNIPTDLPFAVVCYSGQTAGWASAYLNTMGYESRSLLFGMCGWTSTLTGSWDNNIGNALGDPETTNNNGDLDWHMYPTLDDYSKDARAAAVLAEGFQGVSYGDIAAERDDYFFLNYWAEPDYSGTGTSGTPGHIPGAFQFTPGTSLTLETMLGNLPSQLDDPQIIVYCWTGQTSSQITMYLRMMGYDAYSLKFGANSLFHNDLTGHVWNGNLQMRDIYDADGNLVDQSGGTF